MNVRSLIHIFIVVVCTGVLSACYDYNREIPEEVNVGNCYINLAISVSNGNDHFTRTGELPTGGEDGNGREAGFEHENNVYGITLILYQGSGINDPASTIIDFVDYYPVSVTTSDPAPIEKTYETGNQLVPHNSIDFTKSYQAIVVANANLRSSIIAGTTTLGSVRDLLVSDIYSGNETKLAGQCNYFVMSNEKEKGLSFGTPTKDASGDYHYDLTAQPIVIERLAARIDFWAANSNGYKTSTDNPAYSIPGYEYNVTSSTDKFVVTGIVPFNLTNGHATYGNEYLIKRLKDDLSATTVKYLADETAATSYVIDPQTLGKTVSVTPTLTSPLSGLYTLIVDDKIENTTYNPYFHSVESMRGSTTGKFSLTEGSKTAEDIIVTYPMENCLLPESKLYYHATGIAIVGYYYKNGTGTGSRMVYMGYLRHQGEDASYDIQPSTTPLAADATMGTTPAMNFGIVRNNIYRVSIEGISPLGGKLSLKIAVHDWRHVEHPTIYI